MMPPSAGPPICASWLAVADPAVARWQLLPRHQVWQQSRHCRPLERARGGADGDEREDSSPIEPAHDRSQGQRRRRQGRHQFTEADNSAPVVAVGHVTYGKRQHHHGHELHEPDEPQIERASGQRVEMPADGDPLPSKGDRRADAGKPIEGEGWVPDECTGRLGASRHHATCLNAMLGRLLPALGRWVHPG